MTGIKCPFETDVVQLAWTIEQAGFKHVEKLPTPPCGAEIHLYRRYNEKLNHTMEIVLCMKCPDLVLNTNNIGTCEEKSCGRYKPFEDALPHDTEQAYYEQCKFAKRG